jgi:hypothetical protein
VSAVLWPDALVDNRAGRLTGSQRKNLAAMSRGWRKAEVQFAGIFAVIGLLVWFAQGPARYAVTKPLVGIAFLVLAVTLLVIAVVGADPVTRDARAGRVASAEGAIRKWTETTHGRSSSTTSHYAQVDNVRVEMSQPSYQDVPDAGIVRIFYLPNSHRLVNFEQLADRPLPDGALTDPHFALKAMAASIFGSADAHAEIAAMEHVVQAQVKTSLTPPAAGTKPLGDTLPGTWTNPMMSVTFGVDGSVSALLPGGMKRSGHWSVDSSGHLITDLMGRQGSLEAWITGEELTVELGGQGVMLHRQITRS